jgi:hypothetical protein
VSKESRSDFTQRARRSQRGRIAESLENPVVERITDAVLFFSRKVAESFGLVKDCLFIEAHFFTMKDMKSMKGWFAVCPNARMRTSLFLYSNMLINMTAIHFLSQNSRKDFS